MVSVSEVCSRDQTRESDGEKSERERGERGWEERGRKERERGMSVKSALGIEPVKLILISDERAVHSLQSKLLAVWNLS